MRGCWQLVFACCLLVHRLSAEDSVKDESTPAANPDEELEKNTGQRIASLQNMGQGEMNSFTDMALGYYNKEQESAFMFVGNANVTVKVAIGSMVGLRMTLEKTNCTQEDVGHQGRLRFPTFPDLKQDPPKYCGSLSGHDKEQLDCTFDFFKDERRYGEAVVGHECKQVKVIDKSMLYDEDTNF